MTKYCYGYTFPIGDLFIAEENDKITNIAFSSNKIKGNTEQKKTNLIQKTIKELNEYFAGKRVNFDIPLHLEGTNFQKQVWSALQTIKYGETKSYKDIALSINNPKALRAVGMANHNNPISIIIPCHRVIGANKKLVGYGGGLAVKEYLLKLEKAIYN